jgi:GDP-L-fucose synthase
MRFGERRGIPHYPRVVVLGDTGFFGRNIKPILEKRFSKGDVICSQGTKFFDLTQQGHTKTLFKAVTTNHGPIQVVFHLAAMSGGMFSNMEKQATYWYNNTMMIANVMEQCATHQVRKLILPIGGCSYPDECPREDGLFYEEDIWAGFPNENSFGYSMAKKQAIVAGMAYEKEFGLLTHVLIPTNPIGPWDNCSDTDSHVPMALIKRFLEAKENGYATVTVFGSGKPERDFLFIEDIVSLFPEFVQHGEGIGPTNISSGIGTSIAELAETIAKVTGFTGKIHYDKSKPDGQMRKVLSNEKLKSFLSDNDIEWKITPLEEAISITVDWYINRVKTIKRHDDAVG